MNTKRKARCAAYRVAVWAAAALAVALLAGILGTVLVRGLPGVTWQLLSSVRSDLRGTDGILPNIISTLLVVCISLLVCLPLGVGAAVYLNEYCENKALRAAVEFTVETLAGIPSIIYGLVGYLVFCQRMKMQGSILAGSLTVAVMVLPTIIRTTQEALKTVPQSYREGAAGLGATRWTALRTIVLPCTAGGILNGCILAIGRIVGESAALLFTAGADCALAPSLKSAITSSGGTLAVSLYVYVTERARFDLGFAIAAVLLILVLCINMAARATGKRMDKRG